MNMKVEFFSSLSLDILNLLWNLLYVFHVEREENVIRIISAPKATRQERAEYEG